ncbi:MAG: hypothetical protein WCJ84_02570 [Candidatus Peregrinibacteria bacterium]
MQEINNLKLTEEDITNPDGFLKQYQKYSSLRAELLQTKNVMPITKDLEFIELFLEKNPVAALEMISLVKKYIKALKDSEDSLFGKDKKKADELWTSAYNTGKKMIDAEYHTFQEFLKTKPSAEERYKEYLQIKQRYKVLQWMSAPEELLYGEHILPTNPQQALDISMNIIKMLNAGAQNNISQETKKRTVLLQTLAQKSINPQQEASPEGEKLLSENNNPKPVGIDAISFNVQNLNLPHFFPKNDLTKKDK